MGSDFSQGGEGVLKLVRAYPYDSLPVEAEAEWALDLARESLETGRAFIRWWTEEEPSV